MKTNANEKENNLIKINKNKSMDSELYKYIIFCEKKRAYVQTKG
jgi:hypothetical protein